MYASVITLSGKELGSIEFDSIDEFDIEGHIENGDIVIIGQNLEDVNTIVLDLEFP